MAKRSIVYIDGFNLYYGALRGTPYKWLNLQRYFTLLRTDDDLQQIHYFTALISGPTQANQNKNERARSCFVYGALQDDSLFFEAWRRRWLTQGIPPDEVDERFGKMLTEVHPPSEGEVFALLQEAGFVESRCFFGSLFFGAWIARKA